MSDYSDEDMAEIRATALVTMREALGTDPRALLAVIVLTRDGKQYTVRSNIDPKKLHAIMLDAIESDVITEQMTPGVA